MTLKEKIGQLNQEKTPAIKDDFEELLESVKRGEVGSLLWTSSAYAGAGKEKGINVDLMNEIQKAAVEAANDGIQWSFAPMVDLSRDPRWGRIIEGPGEDPYVGARFAADAAKIFIYLKNSNN